MLNRCWKDPILLWASYFHLLCLRPCRRCGKEWHCLVTDSACHFGSTYSPPNTYLPSPTPSFTFSVQMFATDISICFQVPHATQAPNIPKRMIVVPLFRQIGNSVNIFWNPLSNTYNEFQGRKLRKSKFKYRIFCGSPARKVKATKNHFSISWSVGAPLAAPSW